jgi:outer membrane protein assembly factor BamB
MKSREAFQDRTEGSQMAQGPRAALLLALLAVLPLSIPTPAAAEPTILCGTVLATGCEAWTAVHAQAEGAFPEVVAGADGTRAFTILESFCACDGQEGALVVDAHDASTGALVWRNAYTAQKWPTFRMAVASPDGDRLHIAGHGAANNSFLPQAFVVTFDAHDGSLLWATRWDVYSEGYAITTSADGSRVFATGMYRGHDYTTNAFNAQTGQKLWETRYDNRGGDAGDWHRVSYDAPFAVAAAPDGATVYVTGTSASATGILESATIAYDALTGGQRWVHRAHATDGPLGEVAPTESYQVATSLSGDRVYVFGTHGLRALDPVSGVELWAQEAFACRDYWPIANLGDCVIEVHPNGARLFVATHDDLAAVEAATGKEAWRIPLRIGDHRSGAASDMVMSHDGTRLYVASPSGRDPYVTDCGCDFETVAYNATNGRPVWRAVYDRGAERVTSIDASPTGDQVFVTGRSSFDGPRDVLTTAYDTRLGLENAPSLPL